MISELLGTVLDRSVVFSFNRSGYLRHQKRFKPQDLDVDLSGRIVLVTGANAGIGLASARGLLARGASVHLLCRSLERGETARTQLERETGRRPELWRLDVSSLSDVREFVALFSSEVDILINNAGVLPDERMLTPEGLELTWATNVVGPFLLTQGLLERLGRSEDGRVITVSSGGMLLQKLQLFDVDWSKRPRFDGVTAYANSKRAEVILTEQWAERHPEVTFSSMHPGWVDTQSIRTSLPRFYRVTKRILRTPAQGADTVVWLAACPRLKGISGQFWFDREAVPTHVLGTTRESAEDRERLWAMCRAQAGLE